MCCRQLQEANTTPPVWTLLGAASLSLGQVAAGGSFLEASKSLARVAHQDVEWPALLQWLRELPGIPPGQPAAP